MPDRLAMGSLALHIRLAAARLGQAQAAAVAPLGVTAAEATLLRALYDLGATAPSALAEACGLTRGAITKLVDRLRVKRLVVRAGAGRDDRRYQTLALTGAGASLVGQLTAVIEETEAALFARLSVADRTALDRALASFVDSNR